MNKLKQSKLYRFFKNLYFLMNHDVQEELLYALNARIEKIFADNIRNNILHYYEEHYPELFDAFKSELLYLKSANHKVVFPYKKIRELNSVQSGYDKHLRLPYVVHEGKKLYFPAKLPVESAVNSYRDFIENENLLGGNYKKKAPHQYESEGFQVKPNDVLFDIGSAEGLFTLHHIDKIKKAYLVEVSPYWIDALKATFAPYKEKVIIVEKLVSDENSIQHNTITLASLLENELSSSIYVKMDIEGYEVPVIRSSVELLSGNLDICLACCTYHRKSDADILSQIFQDLNYDTEFSDGYMLFYDENFDVPYFRKGMIRAKKQSLKMEKEKNV